MAIRLPKPNRLNGTNRPNSPLPPPPSMNRSAYVAPTTEVIPPTAYQGAYNDSKFYSWHGRIGRIQYMAYPMFFVFFAMLVLMLVLLAVGDVQNLGQGDSDSDSAGLPIGLGLILGGLWLVALYIHFATTKRRLNDLNKTGWLSLILFIPILSLLLYIYLMVVKGDVGPNDYGLPPKPPSKLAIIVGVVLPLVVVALIGIGAARAIPAYNNYLAKSKTAQIAPEPATKSQPTANVAASTVNPTTANLSDHHEPLRQQTVVITGEQLGNGVNSNTNSQQATKPNQVAANNVPVIANDSLAPTAQNNTSDAHINTDEVKTPSTNVTASDSAATTKSTNNTAMSYEDFIKTSENPIFTDR